MSDGEAVPNVAALVVDGVALSESLLAGDLSEARFRAHIIARHAVGSHLRDVHSTAAEVVRLLGEPGNPPKPGYALGVLAFSEALDRALTYLRV